MSAEMEEFFTEITNKTIDARKEAGQVGLTMISLFSQFHRVET